MNTTSESAITTANIVSAQASATFTIVMDAVKNSLNCKGRGTITYEFIALPKPEGGWGNFVRVDQADGAIINSRAVYCGGAGYSRSDDRHSCTEVEIDLPVGTLNKTVEKAVGKGYGSEVNFYRLTAEGRWAHVGRGRSKRKGEGWVTVVDIDGVCHEF